MKKISLVLINSHTYISIMCILLISGVKCCIVFVTSILLSATTPDPCAFSSLVLRSVA